MGMRTVMCRNENCDVFEQEQDNTFEIYYESSEEYGDWECIVCHTPHEYFGNRQYEAEYDTMAEARGEK